MGTINRKIEDKLPSLPGVKLDVEMKREKSDLTNIPKLSGIDAIEDVEMIGIDDSSNFNIHENQQDLDLENFEDIDLEEPQPSNSFLQKSISFITIIASMSTLPIVGIALPILNKNDAQILENFMENLRNRWEKFETKAPIIAKPLKFINYTKESIIKNTTNLAISAVNIVLLAYNGSSIPFLKDSIVGNSAIYIAKSLKKGWENLEQKPYIGAIFRGINYANQKKTNFLASHAFNTILSYTFSTISLGFGPIGLGVATAATSIDVAVGAVEVNQARVLRDELEHLRSLLKSLQEIEKLEPKAKIQAIEKKPSLIPEEQNNTNIYFIFRKSLSLIVSAQLLNVVTAGVKGLTSPMDLANLGVKAAISASGITYGQLTEDMARVAIQAEIIELRKKISTEYDSSFYYDIRKSRKYDLGEIALNQAAYAKSLAISVKNEPADIERIKQEIKQRDPLFSDYKCRTPKSNLEYFTKASHTCLECVADYLHPFNTTTNFISVCKETNPTITSTPKPQSKSVKLKRSKSEKSISALPKKTRERQMSI